MAPYLSISVRASGSPYAKARVIDAVQSGLNVVALGCSITSKFGGCFGKGCMRIPGDSHLECSGKYNCKRRGFLYDFMRNINQSNPHPGHALYNYARGGSGGGHEAACIRSYVVDGRTDLVLLDFAITMDNIADIVRVHHVLLAQLAMFQRPPAVVLLLNYYWCLRDDGMPANLKREGSTGNRSEQVGWCTRGDDRLKMHQAQHELQDRLSQLAASCGSAALSVFHSLAPRVASGELRVSDLTRDGYHPLSPERRDRDPIVGAWTDSLTAWFEGVVHVPAALVSPSARAARSGDAASTPFQECDLAGSRCGLPSLRCDLPGASLPRASQGSDTPPDAPSACYGADFHLPKPSFEALDGWQLSRNTSPTTGPFGSRAGASRTFGWVSTREGARLAFSLPRAVVGPIELELFFVHSYEHAGSLVASCEYRCMCTPLRYTTRWHKTYSGVAKAPLLEVDIGPEPPEPPNTHRSNSTCIIELRAVSSEWVKLDSIMWRARHAVSRIRGSAAAGHPIGHPRPASRLFALARHRVGADPRDRARDATRAGLALGPSGSGSGGSAPSLRSVRSPDDKSYVDV
jgi:hypothetical protein